MHIYMGHMNRVDGSHIICIIFTHDETRATRELRFLSVCTILCARFVERINFPRATWFAKRNDIHIVIQLLSLSDSIWQNIIIIYCTIDCIYTLAKPYNYIYRRCRGGFAKTTKPTTHIYGTRRRATTTAWIVILLTTHNSAMEL